MKWIQLLTNAHSPLSWRRAAVVGIATLLFVEGRIDQHIWAIVAGLFVVMEGIQRVASTLAPARPPPSVKQTPPPPPLRSRSAEELADALNASTSLETTDPGVPGLRLTRSRPR